MQVIQRTGSVPGIVFATIRHDLTTSTLAIDIRVTQSGHYISRLQNGSWSNPCLTVDSAIMMHAAPRFPSESELSPWLSNPVESPFRTPAHRQAAMIREAELATTAIDRNKS